MGLLTGKRALITGSTGGLGAALAHRYAAEGAHLILTGPTMADLEALDDTLHHYDVERTLVPLDLRHFHGIQEMGIQLLARFQVLDIFVGNAALLGTLGPIHHLSQQVWHDVMGVNLSANWHLIQALDPLLRAAPHGRAIFVTDHVATSVAPYWSAYSVSKCALNHLVSLYAAENQDTTLRINLIDPGPMATAMRAAAMPGEDPSTLPAPNAVLDPFVALAHETCQITGQVIRGPFLTSPALNPPDCSVQ